jgi:hypothetical protein
MSNLPDYDEITRLRLRLAEVELQRDAFKAMADKAVTDLIRQVMDRERWQVGLPGVSTYTYEPTEQPKDVTPVTLDSIAREQEHIVSALDWVSERLRAMDEPKKPAKRKRRG